MTRSPAAKRNLHALWLCAAALLVAVVLTFLPALEFSTVVFTKRSGNTFVGDERYLEARAEAEAAAAAFEGAAIHETVIERVNSKGETTSMVTFDVKESTRMTIWQLLASIGGFSLSSVHTAHAFALCVLLAVVLGALSLRGQLACEHRHLPRSTRVLRTCAAWLGLAAMLCVPLFGMSCNYNFTRQVSLYLTEHAELSGQAVPALERLLYSAAPAGELEALLDGMTMTTLWPLWALLPVLFVFLLGLILLCKGEIKPTLARGGLYAFVIVLCVVILYPFFVMLITAFRSNAETTDMYFLHILPTTWVWSNISDIVARGVPRFLLNSILLSTGATAIALVCGIPAAYAMARMQFRGKKSFLGFVIMSQMFAPVVLLVGITQLMNTLRLNDTILGLMFINAAFNQAFAIWLLRGTFVSISSEMEQAACIDGCNSVSALIRILLPMAAPGIVTTLIFVFINSWNEYTISTVLISTPTNKPITVGITQFSSFNMIEWQYLFASALLATIPVVILFMLIEKHLVSGLTSGGVKG